MKNRKNILRIAIIIVVFIMSACEDEPVILTSGELIGIELMKVVEEHKITRATVWEWDIDCIDKCGIYELRYSNSEFVIEAGIIEIENNWYYNLERIESWRLDTQNSDLINLYFK